MKQDRGEIANKWAGTGNTALFAVVLGVILYKIVTGDYMFAGAIALAGIYSELWNARVSRYEPPPATKCKCSTKPPAAS